MTFVRVFALACLCTLPLAATAQWQWIDKDGRRVFSDQAPPADIPAKNILRQPGPRGSTPVAETATAPAPAPASASAPAPARAASGVPKVSGKDKELEERRKQAEAAEAEKKKAKEAEVAALKEQSCKRAREAKATIDSGVRLYRTNDKGEREILDDKQRAAELRLAENVITRDCAQ